MPLISRVGVLIGFVLVSATSATGARVSAHLVFVSNRAGHAALFAVNADGTNVSSLIRDASFGSAVLSPDGHHLAVTRSSGPERELVSVSPNGRRRRVIARASSVTFEKFSPDGRWIAYADGLAVDVARFDGQQAHPITLQGGYAFLDWSPDSTRLLLRSPNDDLVIFTRAGVLVRTIAHGIRVASWGARAIAVVTKTERGELLSTIDEMGNPVGDVSALSRRVELIGWSKGGRRFAAINREFNGWNFASFWDVVTERAETVVSAPFISGGAWSPDGERLAIMNEPQDGDRVEIDVFVPSPYARIGVIKAVTGAFESFAWSPSGRQIAFTSGSQLFTVNAEGTGRRWLMDRGDAYLIGWAPGPVPKTALRARPLARSESASVTLLRTRAPIAEIAADGYWAAAVVLSTGRDCTHVVAWRAGTSKTMRFQFLRSCSQPTPFLYNLGFATPGIGWHEYYCAQACYDTPVAASVRTPGGSTAIEDPVVVEQHPQRPTPQKQLTGGLRAALRSGVVVLTRMSDGHVRTIAAPSRIVDFELEDPGLYYAYNSRGRGRIVFVPLLRLFR
jgi:Tol biopolymer transport system component